MDIRKFGLFKWLPACYDSKDCFLVQFGKRFQVLLRGIGFSAFPIWDGRGECAKELHPMEEAKAACRKQEKPGGKTSATQKMFKVV